MPGHNGMPQFAGGKVDVGASFRRLLVYARRYIPGFVVAVLLSLAGTVLTLIGPSKLGEMTDLIAAGITGTMDLDAVTGIAMLLVVLYVSGFVLNYLQGFILTTISQRLGNKMRHDVSEKVDRLPLGYLDGTSTGDILSRATNDVDSVAQSLNQSVAGLATALVNLVGSLVLMLLTNAWMTLAGVLSALLGMVLTVVIIGKSQKYFVAQQRTLGLIDGRVEEVMSALDVVHISNGAKSESARFHQINDELFEVGWKASFLSSLMMPLMMFVGNLSYVAICITGGALALNGAIPFGTVVAFMVYIRLFTQPLQTIAQAASSIQLMAAASDRVFEFIDAGELEDESGKAQVDGAVGRVEFDHVRFGYDGRHDIIHDFSATAEPGQKVAIVGPTGAGKTTIVNLLMRFYEVDAGEIRIDGIPTKQMSRKNLHDLFGMVLQDPWFFEGTLRENLAFGSGAVPDERLDAVCEACGLTDYVASLADGYDTTLEPSSISAGQRQLITIARAMVKDAPLLILDEATSSVDTRTEARVQGAMDALMAHRTSFIIAHRLSTIRNADLILYMEDGDIVEMGTHAQLLVRDGAYARLYNSQFME